MKKLAFIFPGQGAQNIGMGLDLCNNSAAAKRVFDVADTILKTKISEICFDGPDEKLKLTVNAQPAILATSIAALEALKEKINIVPDYVAGHSLGEYSALYCAGVLDIENVLKAIQKRAILMNDAAQNTKGTMSAVLGLSSEKVEDCIAKIAGHGVVQIANYNSAEQIVITGDVDAVNLSHTVLKEAGAKRVLPLAVSGAFHSNLMKNAANDFVNFVDTLDIKEAQIPVITNVDANVTTKISDFEKKMPKQICSSVFWLQTIQLMIANGVDTFVEIGPGKVLSGLNKKINSEITTYNVYDMATLQSTADALALQKV